MTAGVGWMLLEGPASPVDWATIRSSDNATCAYRIERIIARYAPAVLVLEEFERGPTRKVDRIRRLCRALVHLAHTDGLEVRIYSRAAIRTCFATVGAVSRHEIAVAIATQIEALRPLLPPKRKFPMDKNPRLSLFNAAALALTHYAVTGDGH